MSLPLWNLPKLSLLTTLAKFITSLFMPLWCFIHIHSGAFITYYTFKSICFKNDIIFIFLSPVPKTKPMCSGYWTGFPDQGLPPAVPSLCLLLYISRPSLSHIHTMLVPVCSPYSIYLGMIFICICVIFGLLPVSSTKVRGVLSPHLWFPYHLV